MKKIVAAAVLVLAAGLAPAALNAYRTGISLPNAVKLADGSVLPAGKYDVHIEYKGFGNAAEFHFFQGGILKGKTPAEARGFPSQAPAGAADASTVKLHDVKVNDPATQKGYTVKTNPGTEKVFPKVETGDKVQPGAAAASFSWGSHGFTPGIVGKTAPSGKSLKLSFDSANSAAGFSALLPAVQNK